jgi:hypothetical protein
VSVLVCRGCCCGTEAKHPGFDHATQLEELRAAGAASSRRARLWTVDCLGPCERSNVVVVRTAGRRWWFGRVLTEPATRALAGWVAGGDRSDVPEELAPLRFDPAEALPVAIDDLAMTGSARIDLLRSVLAGGGAGGAVTMGSHGALGEFPLDRGHRLDVDRSVFSLTQDGGSVVLDAAAPARLLAVRPVAAGAHDAGPGPVHALILAVDAPQQRDSAGHVAVGPDPDAASQTLVDLGVGHAAARFCVRADSPGVLRLLEPFRGRPGLEALEACGPELVGLSPGRVVLTPVGRMDISAPIPPPDGAAPHGPHTHVTPEYVALGLPAEPELALPDGALPAAVVYPPKDWAGP